MASKVTLPRLKQFKAEGKRITMITSYDATLTKVIEAADIDIILVGESLGMVVQGLPNTLGVTLEQMIYHVGCVARVVKRAHVMADMPFMSYQVSPEQALENAGRLLKEAGAESVKLEGGLELADTVYRLNRSGIPVMAHIGLRPQSIHQMGGYVVQGKKSDDAQRLIKEAKAHEEAGAFGLLLEGLPATLAKEIGETVSIPTVGIGAGPDCDGQVLVIYDLLGMDKTFNPKFCKQYAQLHDVIAAAVKNYVDEVREGTFPTKDHCY